MLRGCINFITNIKVPKGHLTSLSSIYNGTLGVYIVIKCSNKSAWIDDRGLCIYWALTTYVMGEAAHVVARPSKAFQGFIFVWSEEISPRLKFL